MENEQIVLSWSGGKDSAMALEILQENGIDVAYLLTTLSPENNRITMHGVREELLEKQSESTGIPLIKMQPSNVGNLEYEESMKKVLRLISSKGIQTVAFGDIFLEDLRHYREQQMETAGMKAMFPLWGKNTSQLMQHFFQKKFRTVTCCVTDQLGEEWVGVELNSQNLKKLPAGTDACGEYGEFHTFCFEGPVFKDNIPIIKGEKIYRELPLKLQDDSKNSVKGFWYIDLLPK